MAITNYYAKQLEILDTPSVFPMTVKFFNDGKSTKQMALSKESASVIIDKLRDTFKIP